MHLFRFVGQVEDNNWVISGDELTHLRRTLRLPVGHWVQTTDGVGRVGEGPLTWIDSKRATVSCENDRIENAQPVEVVFLIRAFKSKVFDEILPSLVELGVTTVHLYLGEKTAKDRLGDKSVARWERIIIQACKQSKRAYFPKIKSSESLQDIVKEYDLWPNKFLLLPGAASLLHTCDLASGPVILSVGSEEGFSPRETAILEQSRFQARSLGPYILRAKTATVAAAAVLAGRILRETMIY
jgi:16S rRNA (uracil1498-N3)-methyltransferase